MRTRTWSLVAAATLAGAMLAPLGSQAAQTSADSAVFPPIWDYGPEGERYVSFGDSFTSGPGIPTVRPGICSRSDHNFPTLLATALDVQSFTDASCGGAQSTHFWNPQPQGDSANPPQLQALGENTTLVTLGTMGGNDVGLISLAMSCLGATDCTGTPDDANHDKANALVPIMRQAITDTRAAAPNAEIVVVGYSTYMLETACAPLEGIGVTSSERAYLQGLIDHVSDSLADAAEAEDVAFADMRLIPGVVEHTACAAPEQQWIRAVNPYNDGASLHPSTAGMVAWAGHLEGIVRDLWEGTDHPLPYPPRPEPTPTPTPTETTTPSPSPSTPAPTTTPVPTTPPAPGPTDAELKAQAAAALKSVKVRASCRTSKGTSMVRLQVKRGKGLIDQVTFKAGKRKLGTDRAAAWRLDVKAAKVRSQSGKLKARVVVRAGSLTQARSFVVARPACARR